MNYQRHTYHLVDPSPWPLVASLSAFTLMNGAVLYFHFFKYGGYILILGLILVISTMAIWWRDVIREATFEGHHTKVVQKGLKLGVILFIISEIMFFFAFFWAYFHASLAPSIELGSIWPPLGIYPFNPLDVPGLNTIILLGSGITVTWAHYAMGAGIRHQSIVALFLTVFLAGIFTLLQIFEYLEAPFNISDGVYGSTFYLATGFHGAHVIIGTIFLIVCLIRQIKYHFTKEHHLGFNAAAWYWHFVDVVWLVLYGAIYYWGAA